MPSGKPGTARVVVTRDPRVRRPQDLLSREECARFTRAELSLVVVQLVGGGKGPCREARRLERQEGQLAKSPTASSPNASSTMRANKGANTKPELRLRRLMREAGYSGYRIHWRKAPGRPDIAYPGRRVAIFVNGCFWHRCPACSPPMPKANRDFWAAKFNETARRDATVVSSLTASGWTVVVVWECELASSERAVVARVVRALRAADRHATAK